MLDFLFYQIGPFRTWHLLVFLAFLCARLIGRGAAAQANASHILVETEADAERLKKRIANGDMTFASAAQQYSKCPSKAKGGNLGTFGKGAMVPAFDKVVFSAPLNQLQGPIQTQFGYHLIVVHHRKLPATAKKK